MTFAFHHYSGMVLGILIARLLGIDPVLMGVIGFIFGGFSDSASWVIWYLSHRSWWPKTWKVWERWELYNMCHPVPGGGQWDKIGKWIPFWGQHTWLIDSIVHPTQPKFIFPKFPVAWTNVTWITVWPSHWNIKWTKWDVLYVVLEASLWTLYTLAWIYLK